ncbi:MAG: alpha/beta hydrolase [Flavobacteriaceae bacterium]
MKNLLFLILFFPFVSFTQTTHKSGKDISVSPMIDGTILVPETNGKPTLAILIGGSGPTDRNGNQSMMKNNSLRFLAEGLYEKGIATFRYDKRILKQLKEKTLTEEAIRFDDFIKDAKDVIAFFKRSDAFSKIYVIGHSQGSLVGMIAAQNGADGFISIAGAGQEIDDVIVDQIALQSPGLKDNARTAFDDMRANGIAVRYSLGLASIFRPQIQPFMISWMKYNPQTEIAKLQIPVLIINGEKDIQVQVAEAEKLKAAFPDAQYEIIPLMNHIFKQIDSDDIDNSKSYNDPSMPVMPELIAIISDFIKK